jgi:hypothetical protein
MSTTELIVELVLTGLLTLAVLTMPALAHQSSSFANHCDRGRNRTGRLAGAPGSLSFATFSAR